MVMLWRSLRAVLRKESWIFCCAALVAICRSPSFRLDAAPLSLGRAIGRSVFRAEALQYGVGRRFSTAPPKPQPGSICLYWAGVYNREFQRGALFVTDVSFPTDFNTNLLMMFRWVH